jgi:hypothetical protein
MQLNPNHVTRLLVASVLVVVCAALSAERLLIAQAPAPDASNPSPPGSNPDPLASIDSNLQVLTRGAVHEAYGQPVVFDPTPSPVVPQQPPASVQEIPPAQKPDGDSVQWIPGYWTWDADHSKFVWTSGIWRAIPPGLQWVPGYWTQSGSGYQWVSGFWQKLGTVTASSDTGANSGTDPGAVPGTDPGAVPGTDPGAVDTTGTDGTDTTHVNYLPQPPNTLETGPVGDPPNTDCIWIPGVWIYRGGSYAWLAGQWCPCHAGWVWCPAHYCWTPGGYVFVDGFWDYDLDHRGVLFAPVAFVQPPAVDYVYTPTVCLNSDVFINYLFCQPQCCCYCFGDYYAQNDLQAGYYPCFAYHMSKFGYDPLYGYSSWQHHNDPGWHETLLADYRSLVANVASRPPQTYTAFLAQSKSAGGKAPTLALPLTKLVRQSKPLAVHFTTLSLTQRQQVSRTIQNSRAVAAKRLSQESQSHVHVQTTNNQPTRGQTSGDTKPRPVTTTGRTPLNNQTQQRPVTNTVRTPSNNQTQRRPVTNTGRTPPNNQTPRRPVTNTVRTPPVTGRRPVSTGTQQVTQRVNGEHPVQRLSNPQFVPRPSNQGRSQPAPKSGRR